MQIALVRHGRPLGADNPFVDAAEFARWVKRYERSHLRADSVPPRDLRTAFRDFLVVSSDRPRSMDSAEACVGRRPDLRLEALREMDIPHYRVPLRLPAYAWVFLNCAIWMAGIRGGFESFAAGKARARQAATALQDLAAAHERVVVFGHAILNRLVAHQLRASGWRGKPSPADYWSVIHLEKPR